MILQLIPVIEITHYDQDVPLPEEGPYWAHPEAWEHYRAQAARKAGFTAQLRPYAKAGSFYRISELCDADILKAIEREIEKQQTEEALGVEDLVCAFSGGYVLRIDEEDIYFPQCCGGLDDFAEWEQLLNDNAGDFYAGHPSPRVTKAEGKICLDFDNAQPQEGFAPPVPYPAVELDTAAFAHALQEAKKELDAFAGRLHAINRQHNLQITEIDKRLILGYEA